MKEAEDQGDQQTPGMVPFDSPLDSDGIDKLLCEVGRVKDVKDALSPRRRGEAAHQCDIHFDL